MKPSYHGYILSLFVFRAIHLSHVAADSSTNDAVPATAAVPGAIAQGANPNVWSFDDRVDIEGIERALNDLVGDATKPLPDAASGCTIAQSAYATCSSANANFSVLPQTQQAGCLCNAQTNIDFNADIQGCYNWAQAQNGANATQLHSRASYMANATSLCAPCPTTHIDGLPTYGGAFCSATASPVPSSPNVQSSPTPTSTKGGAGSLSGRAGKGKLMMAFSAAIMSIFW